MTRRQLMRRAAGCLLVLATLSFFVPKDADAAILRSLSLGSQGSDVSELQESLRAKGFFTYPVSTGYFGATTQQAVMAYQKANGLEQVGNVGPQTRALLNGGASVAGTVSAGSSSSSALQSLLALLSSLQAQLAALQGSSAPHSSGGGSSHSSGGSKTTASDGGGSGGTDTTPPPVAAPEPTLAFSASASTVASGGTASLTWSATDATGCTASGAWSGSEPTSGTLNLTNLTTNGSYVLTCTGAGGSVSGTKAITVTAPSNNGSYPASVVAAGLQNVWDVRSTAGLQGTPTHTPAKDALPAGTRSVVEAGQNMIHITQAATFNGWDFSGYRISVDGSIPVTFINTKFAYPGGYALLDMGANADTEAPTVTCTHCEFDLGGMIEFYESAIRDYGNTTFTLQDSYLHDAPRDYITVITPGTFTATRNYIRAPGVNSKVGDHIEAIHMNRGTQVFSQNLFDMADGAGRIVGGITGIAYTQNHGGPINTTYDKNIFVGSAAMKLLYVLQEAGQPTDSLTLTNNLIEKGSSPAYVGNSGGKLILTGNRDFNTGNLIPDASTLIAGAAAADISSLLAGLRDQLAKLLQLFHA